jgi:hypothetical protein
LLDEPSPARAFAATKPLRRRRREDTRFTEMAPCVCLWLFLSLPAVWVAVSVLLHVLCQVDSPLFLVLGPFMVGIMFATLLPFLILSWSNALFGERLKTLFHLEPPKPTLGNR